MTGPRHHLRPRSRTAEREVAADPGASSRDVVTTVVRRRVRPGRQGDYETWLGRLQADARDLDGFLSAETRPPTGPDDRTYTSIFRFASLAQRDAFHDSTLNRQALGEVIDIAEADPLWDTYSGLELWFTPPPGTVAPQPVRWRMALLIGTVVYLLVLLFGTLATATIGGLPAPVRLAIVIAVEITLMTYFLLPYLTPRLARWIFPGATQD